MTEGYDKTLIQRELQQPCKFRQWLQSKDPITCVGISNRGLSCPLATYLRDIHGQNNVSVGRSVIMDTRRLLDIDADNLAPDVKLPAWAEKFVTAVDHDALGWEHAISASTALRLLDEGL